MNVLITGGTGFIGAYLARRRLAQGDRVVIFDVAPNTKRIADIMSDVKVVQGNLANASEVYNTVRDNGIEKVLHLGAMLSSPCEASPWAALQVNVLGTVNVLEAARLFGQPQVIYTSTISTFGLHTGTTVTDTTVQHPTTMYGCGKAFVENLGRYYRSRFEVDFRCVRLSSVMGPGASARQISQFNGIVQLPLSGKPFTCSVTPDVKVPNMYFKDAALAVEGISDAPHEAIQMVIYNVGGIAPTPSIGDIEKAVKRVKPDAQIAYAPDPKIVALSTAFTVDVFDDACARKEWGWKPAFQKVDDVVADFKAELDNHPNWYV
ncbi:MAG: NAD-dependent epimerase/dehydratase family protein [Dehalococcoidia bacterium]|jgi:threonine 3-dehydrogenase|nr:NAD-dependent epimerase/dehydratase family protein [Dehalococcoidia bacterium]